MEQAVRHHTGDKSRNEFGVPAVVDRSTFQAELDALPVREKARCDAGGHGCMGSKQYDRKDAWSHHAKDTPGEKHRTGSIRICARPPQAQVPLSIGISIHAEP